MFVHPRQIEAVIKRVPEVARARLEVSEAGGKDAMLLLCEAPETPGLVVRLEEALRIETRLRGEVRLVGGDVLPDDGKIIDDRRALSP